MRAMRSAGSVSRSASAACPVVNSGEPARRLRSSRPTESPARWCRTPSVRRRRRPSARRCGSESRGDDARAAMCRMVRHLTARGATPSISSRAVSGTTRRKGLVSARPLAAKSCRRAAWLRRRRARDRMPSTTEQRAIERDAAVRWPARRPSAAAVPTSHGLGARSAHGCDAA